MRYLTCSDVRGTDLIEVRFTTPNPALSAFLAAAHTQAYIEANEEARLATDVTAKEFLGAAARARRASAGRARRERAARASPPSIPNVAVNQEQKRVGQRITELVEPAHQGRGHRASRWRAAIEFLDRRRPPIRSAYFLDKPGIQKLHLALLDLRAQRAALDATASGRTTRR